MARRQRPEQNLQIAVMRYLDLVLPKEAIAFHVPNGGGRSKAEAGIFKAMGVRAGIPDLIIFLNGKTYSIELKAGSREVTPAQIAMRDKLSAAGVAWKIAYSLDDVSRALANWEIPSREIPHQRAGRGEG